MPKRQIITEHKETKMQVFTFCYYFLSLNLKMIKLCEFLEKLLIDVFFDKYNLNWNN